MSTTTAPADTAQTLALDVRDLTVHYGRRSRRKPVPPAVDGVSFSIAPGETIGLVGESGSGKSTIGKAVLGLQSATGGSISFFGDDITHAAPARRRALAAQLRVVFQDPYSSLNPAMTIGDTLAEPLRLMGVGKAEAARRARTALERVGLPASAADRFYLPVLRWPTAARRGGPCPGVRPEGRGVRRAGERTGPVHPGAGAQPARRPA